MDVLLRLIARRPAVVLAIVAVLTALAADRLVDFETLRPRLEIDASFDRLLPQEGDEREFYEFTRNLSMSGRRQMHLFRQLGIRLKKLLYYAPPLVKDLHEFAVIRQRTDNEILILVFANAISRPIRVTSLRQSERGACRRHAWH